MQDLSGKRVLVTGGTGFIGSHVVKLLADQGATATAVDLNRNPERLERLGVADVVEVKQIDIRDPTAVFRVISDVAPQYIIHLAAITDSSEYRPRDAIDINLIGTNNIFEAARVFDDTIERVAWASSTAAYAPPERYNDTVSEDVLVYPDSLYGATKEYNEHQARLYQERYGISQVAMRPNLVFGPHAGGPEYLYELVHNPARGDPVTIPFADAQADMLFVEDAADAFIRAAVTADTDREQRIYNLRGEQLTFRHAAAIVSEIIPDADITLTNEEDHRWGYDLDMGAAKRDLGFEPSHSIEEGLRRTYRYLDEYDPEVSLSQL